MSKYLEFKKIPFKGKTKRFEVVSKTSFDICPQCEGTCNKDGWFSVTNISYVLKCSCNGLGKIPIVLGRIQWYAQWRQYVFMPGYPTVWNRDCMNDIIFFITNLMKDRKIILMKEKS